MEVEAPCSCSEGIGDKLDSCAAVLSEVVHWLKVEDLSGTDGEEDIDFYLLVGIRPLDSTVWRARNAVPTMWKPCE